MNDTLHLHPEFGPLPMFIIQQNCVDSFLSPFVNGKISIVKIERDYLNVITWANYCCHANHGQLFSY
jgi:hypothetical protein